jgi:DNA-binding NtrC family response regulator
MRNLLIIDDNKDFLEDVSLMLKPDFNVLTAETAYLGLDILKINRISVVLLDLQLPDLHGLDVLEKIHTEIDPYLPVIIITEFDNIEYVVKAMKLGAYDFLTKDFHVDLIKQKIEQSLAQKDLKIKVTGLQNSLSAGSNDFIFASESMKKISYEITKLANLDFDVLLSGETGVGKDMIASRIHLCGKRNDKPYIPIPIRSLNESMLESELFGHEKGAFTGADRMRIGKFEAGNQGIIYLPEISNLSESIQLKLLHFTQYKSISRIGQDPRKGEIYLDVRLIMATNENLEILKKNGRIREDFYYRIKGVTLLIPPLRERKDDIIPLADYFLKKYSSQLVHQQFSFSDEVLQGFLAYSWPGNVRELANSIKNALSYTDSSKLQIADFPNLNRKGESAGKLNFRIPEYIKNELPKYKELDKEIKRNYFTDLMDITGGKITPAAEIAGLTPQGLRKILKQIDLRDEN